MLASKEQEQQEKQKEGIACRYHHMDTSLSTLFVVLAITLIIIIGGTDALQPYM